MLHRRCTNSTESHRSMSAVPLCKAYARRLVDAEARNTGRPVKDCIRAVARRLREPHGSIRRSCPCTPPAPTAPIACSNGAWRR